MYGETIDGGTNGLGTVFKVNAKTGAQTVIYSFDGTMGSDVKLLYQGGALYGTTPITSSMRYGNVYKVVIATGAATILHSFTGGVDGEEPLSELIYNSGVFYGTTYNGGAKGYGTVFALRP